VTAATLLIVGELDPPVIDANRAAYDQLRSAYRRELVIVPQATHLFEEPGALAEVASLAGQFFVRYLGAAAYRRDQKQSNLGTVSAHSFG
jgi:putative phosphoribosyl transferase